MPALTEFAPPSVLRRLRASDYWRDIAWLGSGTAIAQLINVAIMPVFSRIYTPAEFAAQNLFVQAVGFVGVVMTLRYEYLIKRPLRDADAWRMVSLVALLGVIATIVATPAVWLFRGTLARWTGDAALSPWMAFIPVTAVAMSLAIAVQGYTQRSQQYARSGMAEIVGRASYFTTVLAGAWLLPGAGGLILGSLGGAIGKISWLVPRLERRFPHAAESHGTVARAHGRMGVSLVVSHFLLAVSTIIPISFIAHAYGADMLGQFAMANNVIALPSGLVGNAIGDVFYQRAAKRWADGQGFADIWRTTATKLIIIGLPLYGLCALLMPWAFPLIFGHQWVEAGRFGAVLCIAGFLSFATSPMGWANVVVDADWYGPLWMAMRALTAGFVIALAIVLHWGIWAFVISIVAQNSAMYLFDYWAKWRFSNRRPHDVE